MCTTGDVLNDNNVIFNHRRKYIDRNTILSLICENWRGHIFNTRCPSINHALIMMRLFWQWTESAFLEFDSSNCVCNCVVFLYVCYLFNGWTCSSKAIWNKLNFNIKTYWYYFPFWSSWLPVSVYMHVTIFLFIYLEQEV